MTPVFADTGFYVALGNPRDALHARAVAVVAGPPVRIVTTEFVLVEVANFFSHPSGRGRFIGMVNNAHADPDVEIVPAASDLFARGLALFAARPDKDWSLTDCVSFVVMADRGLADALTADHHFAQAGFRPLLV